MKSEYSYLDQRLMTVLFSSNTLLFKDKLAKLKNESVRTIHSIDLVSGIIYLVSEPFIRSLNDHRRLHCTHI